MIPSSTLTAWLGTYLVHSTVLLGVAWLATRLVVSARAREVLWRAALFGGLATATVQVGWQMRPALGRLGMEAVRQTEGAPFEARSSALPGVEAPSALQAAPVRQQRDLRGVGALALGLGVTFGALSIALGVATLNRRRRLQVRVTDGHAVDVFRSLALASPRLARTELWQCPRAESPYATGVLRPRVVVPERALRELDSAELRALFAHELAHLERRDPLWLGATRALQLCLPLQPLNALARRRLNDCAELLCDERALGRTGDRLALAQSLAKVASWLIREDHLPDAACAMASRRSLLGLRVERILDEEQPAPRVGASAARAAALVGLVGTALAAPAVHLGSASFETAGVVERPRSTQDRPEVALAALLTEAVQQLELELELLQRARQGRDLDPSLTARIEQMEQRVLTASARAKRIRVLLERAAPIDAGAAPAFPELEEPNR